MPPVGDNDKELFDDANINGGAGSNSSSLPSSLLPHLYTGPSSGRASRDSGTRTTLHSVDDGDRDESDVEDENRRDDFEHDLKYSDSDRAFDDVDKVGRATSPPANESSTPLSPLEQPYRLSMTASAGGENLSSPSSTTPTASSLSLVQQQEPSRSHHSTGEPLGTTSLAGNSSPIEIRLPIRSDPVFYAQGIHNTYGYSQNAGQGTGLSPRRSSPGRRGSIGGTLTGGPVFNQSTSLSASMLPSPLTPDSPYSQQYDHTSSSHSSTGSYKDYQLSHMLIPHGREWPQTSMTSVPPGDQHDYSRTHSEHDGGYYSGRKRKFDELEERALPALDAVAPTPGGTVAEAGPSSKPKKVIVACGFCRKRRIRCDGNRPSCFQCLSREDQECHYDAFPRRRGPGKANKGSRGAKAKNGTIGRPGKPDEDEDPANHEVEAQSQYQMFNERAVSALTSHHQPNLRDPYYRESNEGYFMERLDPQLRQAVGGLTHHQYLPHHSQIHQYPPLPYPTGISTNRWNSQEVSVRAPDLHVQIWEPPLPTHPYNSNGSPLSPKSESPVDRFQIHHRMGTRYDLYAAEGGHSSYPVFEEQYESNGLTRNVTDGQGYRSFEHESQSSLGRGYPGTSLSTSRYLYSYGNHSEIPRAGGRSRMSRSRSGTPSIERTQTLRDERLDVDA
ncbi:hypothetical protein V5O48_000736 [Marasmius crinis-equi]|uniref:Zn(2)-C6 fungal-type domain-containing protein n=1 Tax=Marasmius crinis-equi TaxID=585013 RepID=A0ABR3G0J4_9AGAR